jgi:hypothetical protein
MLNKQNKVSKEHQIKEVTELLNTGKGPCGGITVQFDEEETDIHEDLYCMKKMILMDWTCGGIPKKIKDEPKFDEGKND